VIGDLVTVRGQVVRRAAEPHRSPLQASFLHWPLLALAFGSICGLA